MGPRVVVDTNVLVSALGWSGAPRQVLDLCLQGRLRLVLSPPILRELERVLYYPKFSFPEESVVWYLELLTELAFLVEPAFQLQEVVADPADHRVLECALAGGVEFIVSGDGDLKDLGAFEGIQILAADKFLAVFQARS